MKYILLTLFILATTLFAIPEAKAQIKLHDDGHVSLGSLTKVYGVQTQPSGYTYFRIRSNEDYGWITLSYSNVSRQKNWIVANKQSSPSGAHTFFVYGNGYVCMAGSFRQSDAHYQQEICEIDSAGPALDRITGVMYTPSDYGSDSDKKPNRRIGVTAQEVEKVIPEAVLSDENGLLYVDYEALTVFLIEAVKEQRKEIRLLRKTLEENGLMKP